MPRDIKYTAKTLESLMAHGIAIEHAMTKLQLCKRQIYRLLVRYRDQGEDGLKPRNRGRNSPRRYSVALENEVIDLIRGHYPDFGPTFAGEKLLEHHGIRISHETLRKWMKGAGIWADREARRPKVHQIRQRCDQRGELIQIDGLVTVWFRSLEIIELTQGDRSWR
jgi:transposase